MSGPNNQLIADLKAVFGELVGRDFGEADARTSFLDLGLDSLLLTQASAVLKNRFGVKVTFRQLLEEVPSVALLAAYLHDQLPEGSPSPLRDNAAGGAPGSAPASVLRTVGGLPGELARGAVLPASGGEAKLHPLPVLQNGERVLASTVLERVMNEQLAVMALQLEALRSSPRPRSGAAPVPGVNGASPAPAPAGSVSVTAPASRSLDPAGRDQPLAAGPALNQVQRACLDALITRYTAKTARSKALTQQYRQWYADPRTASGFNKLWKEMVYQIVVEKSAGARLWDIDGNEYIDLLNGFGPSFLGHSPDFIVEALKAQLDQGFEVGPQSPLAGEAAKMFCEFTGNERASFVCTGSEAVYAAMRLARTVTGRDKIVVFNRDYHGNFDEVLVRGVGTPPDVRSLPSAPGIPVRAVGDMIVLEYGSEAALDYIKAHAGELAAVLIEPVQSRRPELRPREFVQAVRAVTEQHGALLIFDEVITGLRSGPGGAQAYYGIKADLATYGKVVGGGMPLGIVAGKAGFMDTFDGGFWQYGDDSFPSKGVTFFAGTFVRHPLAIAAVHAMLGHLMKQGPEFWETLNRRTARLAETLDRFFTDHEIPIRVPHFCSQFYFRVADDQKFGHLLFYRVREQGIFLLEHFPSYLTAAHTDEDVERAISVFQQSALELVAAGLLAGKVDPGTVAPPLPAGEFPLTEAQQEVWLASQYSREASCAFNESCSVQLRGDLELDRLRQAIRDVLARHEALRARFDPRGDRQHFLPSLSLDLPLRDLSALEAGPRDAEVAAILAGEGLREFDLVSGPLLSFQILRLQPRHHLLVFTVHHLVCDGWSYDVMLSEIGELYSAQASGRVAALPPATPFRDYIRWEQQLLASPEGRLAEQWWLAEFGSFPDPLDLPSDYVRPAIRSFRGARATCALPPELVRAARALGAAHGATLFAVFLATFKTLLSRLSGQDDLVVGVPTAGQNLMGADHLVGHCANLLPLRLAFAGSPSFATAVQLAKRSVLAAFEHQGVSFGSLLKKLSPPRDPGRTPLVSVTFNVDPPLGQLRFEGLEPAVEVNPRRCFQFDLGFNLVSDGDGFVVECDYSTELFDGPTIDRWLRHYRHLLAAAVADPETPIDHLPLLDSAQRRQLLVAWNDTAVDYPREQTLHQWIGEQCSRQPDRVAVVFAQSQLTYGDLDRQSGRLAEYLRGVGVGVDSLVGLHLERSADMIVAALAILKAGGAYVPLDPAFPAERLGWMIEDAAMPIIVTQSSLAGKLPPHQARLVCLDQPNFQSSLRAAPKHLSEGGRAAPEPLGEGGSSSSAPDPTPPTPHSALRTPHSDSLAYVIYTSGSTGRPKGVEITHRALVNFLASMQREPGLGADDVVLALTTLSFDIAGLELWLPLVTGARVVVGTRETAVDPERLTRLIESAGITVMQATPATWRLLLDGGWPGSARLKALCGGEAFPPDLADKLLPRCREVWNLYGPTETTIWSTAKRLAPGRPLTIGRPIANTRLYLVDAHGEPVPPGVPGELWIGGEGVARGYRNRPELTADKFGPDPFVSDLRARVYRTGDRARWTAAGEVEFLGRGDYQVKIRGHRIELGDVESVLSRHPAVCQTVVVAREDVPGDRRLTGYVVLQERAPVQLWMASPTVAGQTVYDDVLFDLMSADEDRSEAFRRAFRQYVRGGVLLDVGTGKDAILARLAVEAGARKVYAVEILEEPCRKARDLVASLGLQDRIEVLLGDAGTMLLPEKVDACVAEVIGHIGGAEGLERLLGLCRRHLPAGGRTIPSRVVTRFAAVELPQGFRDQPEFAPLAASYVERLFAAAGSPFDLRLSISGLDASHLRSTVATFEECVFTGESILPFESAARLELTADAEIDGFLLWLEISLGEHEAINSLSSQQSWLPVFLPVFSPPLKARQGDVIVATIRGRASANGWNKDYELAGEVVVSGEHHSFNFSSPHHAGVFRGTPFYQRLFAGGSIPSAGSARSAPVESTLRDFLRERLPEYMVPSRLVFLDRLPLTPNGKVDRKALPAPGALTAPVDRAQVAPRTEMERKLAAIWAPLLGLEEVGVTDDFFDLGGHSLLAVKLFAEIERQLGRKLPLATLFTKATIEKLAQELATHGGPEPVWQSLVSIQAGDAGAPLFCVHGAGGNILLYRDLAAKLGAGRPVYGFQSRGLDGLSRPLVTIEEMAGAYVAELKLRQPTGPYFLVGYCLGGLVAYQMARLLRAAGSEPALVALLDTYNPAEEGQSTRLSSLLQRARFHAGNLMHLGPRQLGRYLREKLRVARDGEWSNLLGRGAESRNGQLRSALNDDPGGNADIQQLNDLAAAAFRPQPYEGSIVVFKPQVNYDYYPDPQLGWGGLAIGGVEVVEIPVNPHAMLVEPFVGLLAQQLKLRLSRSQPNVRPQGVEVLA